MLRAAADDDRDLVLGWRNLPEVRHASLSTHVIGDEEHRAWWQAVQADERRLVLIYEHAGRAAGVVTFADLDPVARSAVWGYYLDVVGLRERGELLAAWVGLEGDAIGYAFDVLALDRIGGETLADNAQVLALHRRFGFRETRSRPLLVDGVPREVVWTELRATERPRRPHRRPASPHTQ